MKKFFMLCLIVAFLMPAFAFAEVSVLKGEEVVKLDYERDNDVWENEKVTVSDKLFFVIDADPTQDDNYEINYLEAILYWKEGKPIKKYYDRSVFDLVNNDTQLVDLGKKNNIAMTFFIEDEEGTESSKCIGVLKGKKKGDYIKSLKGYINSIEEDSKFISGDLFCFETFKWNLNRTRRFDDPSKTGAQIADDIIIYLESKGYEEEPPDD